jgi:hypothetical protein
MYALLFLFILVPIAYVAAMLRISAAVPPIPDAPSAELAGSVESSADSD